MAITMRLSHVQCHISFSCNLARGHKIKWPSELLEGIPSRRLQKGTGRLNPFRTAVSFWGQLGTTYLEFDGFVPKTGLEV